MNSANKITILLATAALLGCSADKATPDRKTTRQAISFGTTGDVPTRTAHGTMTTDGTGTGELSLQELGFGVFACHTGLHPYVGSNITPNYMWNQQVAYNATAAVWDYAPLIYWPTPVDGLYPYVSFFAYAPYADSPGTGTTVAEQCIVDMSRSVESGDPWIVYQLGGTENDWQDHQVDLLCDFLPDQQQGDVPQRVNFRFQHALAQAGDQITVTCSPELQARLLQAYTSEDVSFILDRVELVYTLLRKGRLRLNGTAEPLWEAVASESPTVRRRLILEPEGGHVLCTATSSSDCDVTDYTVTDQGIFYIPLNVEGCTQQVDIYVSYHTSKNNPGALTTRINLTTVTEAGGNRSFRIVMPEITI